VTAPGSTKHWDRIDAIHHKHCAVRIFREMKHLCPVNAVSEAGLASACHACWSGNSRIGLILLGCCDSMPVTTCTRTNIQTVAQSVSVSCVVPSIAHSDTVVWSSIIQGRDWQKSTSCEEHEVEHVVHFKREGSSHAPSSSPYIQLFRPSNTAWQFTTFNRLINLSFETHEAV
jgi:hypothetical protein